MKCTTKRICAMLLGAVMLFSGMGVMADGNMLKNGDFEGDGNGNLYSESTDCETAAATGDYIYGWRGSSASYLSVKEGTNDHYFDTTTNTATKNGATVGFGGKNLKSAVSSDKVYKLSYDYMNGAGQNNIITFNSGDASGSKWVLNVQLVSGTNEWHNHTVFLYGYQQKNSNATRFGYNDGSFRGGIWGLDNVRLEEAKNEIVFSNSIKTSKTGDSWLGIDSNKTDETKNQTLQTYIERVDPITTLENAITDEETGERKVQARVHYLSQEGGKEISILSAVYKEQGGQKTLHSIDLSTATTAFLQDGETAAPLTAFSVPDITVPAKTDGVKYSVKVMLWNRTSGMNPIMESAEISE